MRNPISGIHYLLAGFSLITRSGLKRFVLIPLIVNIILFVGLFFLFKHHVAHLNVWFTSHVPAWLQWLSSIIWVLFAISFLLLLIYTFVIIGNLIAAPFNGLLSEKVELYLTGKKPESRSLFENIKDTPRIIGRQLAILGYYLPRAIFFLVLFFIPIVQIIAAILWFLFNAWFMTITYLDYPSDNHRVTLIDLHAWIKKRYAISLVFGISVLVCSMIPFVNLITIPAAVAGATKFWLEESKSNY